MPTELKTGRSHLWHERNAASNGPFHITKIDGQLVTITRVPTGTVEVLDCGDDPYFIVKVANGASLRWMPGSITATCGGARWSARITGRNIAKEGMADRSALIHPDAADFKNFDDMAAWARERHNVTAWARDRCGDWVPADDWRAVKPGIPCPEVDCDHPIDRDGKCKRHAAVIDRMKVADEARNIRYAEAREKSAHKARNRAACEATLAKIRPLLTELGIHPDTLTVGTNSDGGLGVLMPAEAAERLTGLAVDAERFLADLD